MEEMPSYSDVVAQVFETEKFSNELHRIAIDTVINRLDAAANEVSEHELLRFIQKLFDKSNDEHQNVVKCETQNSRSNTCLLKVEVVKGENLASKDYDGLSDPFCVVAVVPTSKYVDLQEERYISRKTNIVDSSLNPEWNESLELVLNRNEISNSFVQLQVWDYDGANNNKKKVKGIKGFTRLVHDKFLSISDEHYDSKDDFMGYKSVRLSKIPDQGLEKWLKCKAAHAFQTVSGRIKVKFYLTPILNKERRLNYSTDLLYAGLLRRILNKCYHDDFKERSNNDLCWKGTLSPSAKILLNEFLQQYYLPQPFLAYAIWETYAEFHVKNFPGIEVSLFQDLLSNFETKSNHTGRYQFSANMLSASIEKFIQEECKKLAVHRDLFPIEKKSHVKCFENLLLILQLLGSEKFQKKIQTIVSDTKYDVRVSVLYALENGSSGYYTCLHSKLIKKLGSEFKNNDENHQCEDVDIDGMITLIEILSKDLTEGKNAYGEAFQQCFEIDYVASVASVFHKHLAHTTNDVMKKIDRMLYKDAAESLKFKEWSDKITSLFRLHKRLNEFLVLTEGCDHSREFTLPADKDALEFGATEVDAPVAVTLQSHRQWFLPVVFKWAQMNKLENQKILENAVRLDESVKRVDNIAKHSSSAVDTMDCLNATVKIWNSWEWPNPIDSFTIAKWLASDVSHAIEFYANLVYNKLQSVAFFDDEGQFDVTEQLCIALNNLRVVKVKFLLELPKKMHFQFLANDVDVSVEGMSGEEALDELNSVVNAADQKMEEKIEMVSAEVGARMKPDITKHLTSFAEVVIQQKSEINSKDFGNSEILYKLREMADEANQPLMKYLADNLRTLSHWLNEKNFDIILELLWKNVLESAHKVLFEDSIQHHDPAFFYQSRLLLNNLVNFFHEDGIGLSFDQMKKLEDYKQLEAELKIRSASTGDLVKMFYLQIYGKQEKSASNPSNGVLDLFAWYDIKNELLHVDVICAANLAPLDMNGLSDPFVQLRLSPPTFFKEQPTYQTSVKAKTLNPLWNEEFSFKVEPKAMEEEGTVIICAVLDYDRISSNELEGEAVIPLKVILEKAKKAFGSGEKLEKHFTLPLVRTKERKCLSKFTCRNEDSSERKDSSNSTDSIDSDDSMALLSDGTFKEIGFEVQPSVTPLQLIQRRSSWDKDAEEFLQSRRKFKKAKKKTR